jgi:hypothetical protein
MQKELKKENNDWMGKGKKRKRRENGEKGKGKSWN